MKLSTPKTAQQPSTQVRKVIFRSILKKSALFLLSVAALLAGGAVTVRGQSALDGFDPNANGVVQVVVVQSDGKILIGGDFTTIGGIVRNRIARLNPDGTLDTNFNPNASGYVNTIAVQADGKVLVGGSFNGTNSIGGQTRSRIARLDAVTGAADSFDPNASGGFFSQAVFSIVIQTDGKILVGGGFSTIGGQTRNRIARLDAVTGLVDSFNPAPTGGQVAAIALQADGKILVGGILGIIGGQTRTRIARLDPVTGLADSWNPDASGMAAIPTVSCIAVQADGKILAGGIFNTIGGQTRNNIARLDPVTGLADSWDPNANNYVGSIVVQPDGKILAGGGFNVFYSANTIGGQARNGIARLDAATGLADSFDPNAGSAPGTVNSVAVQADGKILAGGNFTTVAPNGGSSVTRTNIARLETDGSLDRTLADLEVAITDVSFSSVTTAAIQLDGKILICGPFNSILSQHRYGNARLKRDGTLDSLNVNIDGNFPPHLNTLTVQTDGKVFIGGYFDYVGSQTHIAIARFDAAGVVDSFSPGTTGGEVFAITSQADGKILVGGQFSSMGGQTRSGVARVDGTTGLADSFNPNADFVVRSMAVQADGKVLVGGNFTSIGGQLRNRIARLDPTTGLADSFNPDANGTVSAIVVQADGKILVGGQFTSMGGQTRNRIARLETATGAVDSFNPSVDQNNTNVTGTISVNTIALQADGKILAGGAFASIGGLTRNRIARLDATTGLADAFDPNANASPFTPGVSAAVSSITLQADGKVLVGGGFGQIGSQTRAGFARLRNDTAATQNLDVIPTSVTWLRGGSAPHLARVTFESSTNNSNYTPLGSGTSVGANWTLAGLNLPTRQNLYIRARGYYHSGYQNGSGSITESVRYAFLPTPTPILTIQRSANTNVVLSWATNFTGFALESNTNLNTNVWSVVTNTPAVSGTNNVVTNAVGGTARFYRLRQ